MRITRRRFGALALAGGATLALAACSKASGGTSASVRWAWSLAASGSSAVRTVSAWSALSSNP